MAYATARVGDVLVEETLLPLVSRIGFWTSGRQLGSYDAGRGSCSPSGFGLSRISPDSEQLWAANELCLLMRLRDGGRAD
jgi:hypothetical protein